MEDTYVRPPKYDIITREHTNFEVCALELCRAATTYEMDNKVLHRQYSITTKNNQSYVMSIMFCSEQMWEDLK